MRFRTASMAALWRPSWTNLVRTCWATSIGGSRAPGTPPGEDSLEPPDEGHLSGLVGAQLAPGHGVEESAEGGGCLGDRRSGGRSGRHLPIVRFFGVLRGDWWCVGSVDWRYRTVRVRPLPRTTTGIPGRSYPFRERIEGALPGGVLEVRSERRIEAVTTVWLPWLRANNRGVVRDGSRRGTS
jgi:hypothetical protein